MESTFLFEGLNLPFDKKDPLSYKLEALRVYLEKLFGKQRLLFLYSHFENVKNVVALP